MSLDLQEHQELELDEIYTDSDTAARSGAQEEADIKAWEESAAGRAPPPQHTLVRRAKFERQLGEGGQGAVHLVSVPDRHDKEQKVARKV